MKVQKLWQAAIVMVLSLVMTSCSDKNDDSDGPQPEPVKFTIKQVPVSRGGSDGGSVTMRFYDDLPGVAYISAADFQKMLLPGSSMTVEKSGEDIYQLNNGKATATVNTAEETFTSADFMSFTNLMDLLSPGMANVYFDGSPYLRYSQMELSPATSTVSFDFKKYGIDLRGDEGAVYLPFATLSDLYSDLYYHVAAFNGERVYIITDNGNSEIVAADPDFTREALAKDTRTAEQAAYSYGELCFIIDHFYGMPGRSPLESGIQSNGLDATLDAIENGPEIKSLLKSTKLFDYLFGMNCLNVLLDDGGHTVASPVLLLMNSSEEYLNAMVSEQLSARMEQYPALGEDFTEWFQENRARTMISAAREMQRAMTLPDGSGSYRKKGDTAFCIFDMFGITDIDGWKAYYAGTAPMSAISTEGMHKGELVVVLDALKRASEDPEVKNLVIDLTCNSGGSLDVVMAMTSLIANQSKFYSENTLTGQRQVIYYAVDRNFDGKIDAKDQEVKYDLNVAVLTSGSAFSCGNLFPSLMKDMGYLVMGERSGGGSCAVQNFCTPEGLQYQISSYRGRLTTDKWQNIDSGIEPNVSIAIGTTPDGYPDYSAFYDLDALSSSINEWYRLKN